MTNERRTYGGVCELRAEDGDSGVRLKGYAAVFDSMSEDLGGFRDTIRKGAFHRSIGDGADVRALVEHDPARIIGRNKAGTLTLREDDEGLSVDIQPPDTTAGRDVVESVKRGDLTQMSFGFRTVTDEWHTEGAEQIRTLIDVDLFDISVVAYPAYPDTSVAQRGLVDWQKSNDGTVRKNLDQMKNKMRAQKLVDNSPLLA